MSNQEIVIPNIISNGEENQIPPNNNGPIPQAAFIPIVSVPCSGGHPPSSFVAHSFPIPTIPYHENPPSYEDCEDINVPPPSYESLFGKVEEVRKNSNGFVDFVKNLIILALGTVGCAIMIGITFVIPVFMIIIGSLKMDMCPAEKFVPIYLVVGGSLGILKNLASFNSRFQLKMHSDSDGHFPWYRQLQITNSFMNIFLTGWFITGCVWVYRIYEPNYTDPSSQFYCDYALYMFAFWLVTSVYVSAALLTSCICCLSIVTVILSKVT